MDRLPDLHRYLAMVRNCAQRKGDHLVSGCLADTANCDTGWRADVRRKMVLVNDQLMLKFNKLDEYAI